MHEPGNLNSSGLVNAAEEVSSLSVNIETIERNRYWQSAGSYSWIPAARKQ
jgi:hypothetical protein